MYVSKDCKCGEWHRCNQCLPEDAALKLAKRVGLQYILVILHKGHYFKIIVNGEHVGADPVTVELWHALAELDQQRW